MKPEAFSRETTGLAEVTRPEVVELQDGDEFDLRIEPVAKTIGGDTVRMLAYNRSVPGPTLRVRQDSKLIVHVTNEGDLEATVHWHGLRLENRYDGTHETQAPIPVGETFTYEVSFPDPGAYWYHPHIREDYGQEMGLYGNILVVPSDPEYWPPAHREVALTLDDILIEDGMVAAFSPDETTHVAMGRFGNVMLVSGEPDLELEAARGEVIRFYLTNTANTRVFNVALPGARMKLVGADSGHYEREEFVEQLLIAPSERLIVDVHFAEPGAFALEHQTPRAHVSTRSDHGRRRERGAAPGRRLRAHADESRHGGREAPGGALPRCRARQDARFRGRDGPRHARRTRCLRLPDASGGGKRGTGSLPEVRDDAPRDCGAVRDDLRLSDASRGYERRSRPLPQVWDEAHPRPPRRRGRTRARTRGARTPRARHGRPREPRTITPTSTLTTQRRASSGRTTWSR